MLKLSDINPATYRRVLTLFRFGTELLGKLPARGDGVLEIVVKLLAAADSAEKTFGGKASAFQDIFSQYDLKERTSEPFVKLFWGTKMSASFRLRRHGVSEHCEVIEAIDASGERLFFQEHRYGKPEVASEFYYTPGFNFGAAVDALWANYPTGIYLSMVPGRHGWGTDVSFCEIPARRSTVTSAVAVARLEAAVEAHRGRAGVPWAMIAYGPAGTGKSGHAEALARATGGRLLKVDASSMAQIGVQDLGFLLDVLRPGFLLIDDFDRAPVDTTRARLLFLFEHLHAAHAGVTVAVTVNDPAALDAALLRSERIDEAVEFPLPDHAERADVLGQLFLGEAVDVDALATETDGFCHADLAGLAARAKRDGVHVALAGMLRLRALATAAAARASKDAPPTIGNVIGSDAPVVKG